MGNLTVCVTEWWVTMNGREGVSRARQSQARRGFNCCETKPQVNIYLAGKELCPLPIPTSGSHLLTEPGQVKADS